MGFSPELLLVLVLLAGGALWLLAVRVVFPARELLAVLQRIARGDLRPVILPGMPFFLRNAAKNLRETAETLAGQKELLAEEEFSISTILESMTEGVAVTGPDLRIRQVNKSAVAMFHLGNRINGSLLPEVFMSHELQSVAQRVVKTGVVQRGELDVVIPGRKDRCHLLVTAAPLNSPGKRTPGGYLFVFHDVTRLRELEAVRREFVANVSHEFRTPLSIISGYLETLSEESIDREMIEKSVAVMSRHAARLNNLIDDLLTISRMEEKAVRLEKSRISLEPLLRGVIEQLERESTERGVSVRLEVGEGIPFIEVDAYRMEQAFSNLLINALRHGVRHAGGEAASVVVSIAAEGNDVAVSFRDNGPGIPLADQEHLFERFYRVGGDRARQSGGTGLGLSIVKNVVQAHGGRVTLESRPGEGATFTIRLPFAA
jgi:two-component system phosphate regulon sensor histidine kinase PhoR